MIIETGKATLCKVGWQAGDAGKPEPQRKAEASAGEFFLAQGRVRLFVLFCSGLQLIE